VKLGARAGQGEALAQLMMRIAEGLRSTPGCELYVISRDPGDPDVVWVNELWLNQEAVDASLEALRTEEGQAQMAEVMALLDGSPERIDVEPLGGVGFLDGGTGSTIINLEDVEDLAPKFGYGEMGEARFATGALGAAATGVSYQRIRPGVRQSFGHHHNHAEEVFVVLAGSGRVKIDDQIHDVKTLDAVRVAPESKRMFEAGADGLELLVFGTHRPGDAVMDRDFWPA
jgi:quinol monooxygenase YgiN/mannose-6-phosphate isomerase-like protein (cupin superfamily)